jgi:hypothetical protein
MISDMIELVYSDIARGRKRTKASAACLLSLAATPTFAIMALLTGFLDGPPDILCSAAHHASSLDGMIVMYLLMGAFHSAPWLKAISGQRRRLLHPFDLRTRI